MIAAKPKAKMARKSLLRAKECWRFGAAFVAEPCSEAVAPRAASQERKVGRCWGVPDLVKFLTIVFLFVGEKESFIGSVLLSP